MTIQEQENIGEQEKTAHQLWTDQLTKMIEVKMVIDPLNLNSLSNLSHVHWVNIKNRFNKSHNKKICDTIAAAVNFENTRLRINVDLIIEHLNECTISLEKIGLEFANAKFWQVLKKRKLGMAAKQRMERQGGLQTALQIIVNTKPSAVREMAMRPLKNETAEEYETRMLELEKI